MDGLIFRTTTLEVLKAVSFIPSIENYVAGRVYACIHCGWLMRNPFTKEKAKHLLTCGFYGTHAWYNQVTAFRQHYNESTLLTRLEIGWYSQAWAARRERPADFGGIEVVENADEPNVNNATGSSSVQESRTDGTRSGEQASERADTPRNGDEDDEVIFDEASTGLDRTSGPPVLPATSVEASSGPTLADAMNAIIPASIPSPPPLPRMNLEEFDDTDMKTLITDHTLCSNNEEIMKKILMCEHCGYPVATLTSVSKEALRHLVVCRFFMSYAWLGWILRNRQMCLTPIRRIEMEKLSECWYERRRFGPYDINDGGPEYPVWPPVAIARGSRSSKESEG